MHIFHTIRPSAQNHHFTTVAYYDQKPSGFFFLVQIRAFVFETSLELPHLNMKGKNDSDCTDLKRINLPEVSTKSSALLKGLCKHLIFADVIITNRPASKFHGFFKVISSNLWNRIFIFHFLYCYSSFVSDINEHMSNTGNNNNHNKWQVFT